MTRSTAVFAAAILSTTLTMICAPHAAPLSGGLQLAQAEPPPGERRPPGQPQGQPPGQRPAPGQQPAHPPGQPPHAPPPAAQVQPVQPQHVPPPAAQVPPAQLPHVPPPAAQVPPAQLPHVPPPPPAAQTLPAQQPHIPPAAVQTAPAQPLQRPAGAPGLLNAPPAAQIAPVQRPAGLPAPALANVPVDPRTLPQHLDQLRGERHQVQEGNRTIIQESDRTIIREGGHDVIQHNESDRFRFNARDVAVEHRGNDTVTVVLRPDGSRIITEVDPGGRLLRRVRRDPFGNEVILIDNSFEPRGLGIGGFFVTLPPPVVRVPRELYIRETDRATPDEIYLTLEAPPVERIERRYALDEIRYSESLRERMPRVDIDTVNFETGSWEITPDQMDRLSGVGQGIARALQRNPREVFLIEGYTDAVGNDVDNLSLSDRRAEAVAVALSNQFAIPPENLTTQGYGKQFLKIPTDGPERANRRVAVRRITPLLMGQN